MNWYLHVVPPPSGVTSSCGLAPILLQLATRSCIKLLCILGVTDGYSSRTGYRYSKDLLCLDRFWPLSARHSYQELDCIALPLTRQLGEWERHLKAHLNQAFVANILDGLRQGFRIGVDYTYPLSSAKCNMPSATQHPEVVEHYIQGEREKGRMIGPLRELPGCTSASSALYQKDMYRENGGWSRICLSPKETASTMLSTPACAHCSTPRWTGWQM